MAAEQRTAESTALTLPAPVEVLHDGRWHAGTLERWSHDQDRGWRGFVWFSTAPGMRYVHWVPADRLRPTEEGHARGGPVE